MDWRFNAGVPRHMRIEGDRRALARLAKCRRSCSDCPAWGVLDGVSRCGVTGKLLPAGCHAVLEVRADGE